MLKNAGEFNLNKKIKELFKDKLFFIVLLLILGKSILFIGLIGTESANTFDFGKGFVSDPAIILILSFNMVLMSITFLFKGRGHLWALIVIDIIITVCIVGDLWYYRGFTEFLNFFLLSETTNLDNLGSTIKTMTRPIDVIFLIDIIILIIYAITNRELYRGVKRSISLFLITLVVSSGYIYYFHYKVDDQRRCFSGEAAFNQRWAPTQTMSSLGTIGYHYFDGYRYLKNSKKYELTAKDKNDINNWYKNNQENLPDNEYSGMFKGKNLLIIQWESLENIVVNEKYEGQEITPNLNKLLKNSYYFSNYHENVNTGTSSDADLMTNTGVYPVRDGATFFRYPENKYKHSLPKMMESMGYSTYVYHPDKALYWNWRPALQSIGFQNCYDSSCYNIKETIGLGIADKNYFSEIIPMIEKEKQPFYTFVVTLSSHAPYELPKKDKYLNFDSKFNDTVLGKYFQALNYTDSALGDFMNKLSEKGLLDNTMVVIYGDHTSVHKYYADKVASIRPQESWWKNEDKEIPLLVYNPSIQGKTFDVQGGQIDLMPTVSYLMGISKDKYENSALGKVLFNTNKNYTILNSLNMCGKYTDNEKNHATDGIYLSDKMVRSDYFKNK